MSKHKPLPSQAELQHLFNYDPETGLFYWKNPPKPNHKRLLGKVAGNLDKGYINIKVNKKLWRAHRLAWMFIYGKDPADKQIDHINNNKSDNRINNLRLVTNSQNQMNLPDSCSKGKGYTYLEHLQKWKAAIKVNGVTTYLGLFDTAEEARQAYLNAKQQLHIIPA